MNASRFRALSMLFFALALAWTPVKVRAEDYEEPATEDRTKDRDRSDQQPATSDEDMAPPPAKKKKKVQTYQTRDDEKRKYMIHDHDRVDAGIFHVGFAVGGNFYVEPQISTTTGAPTGDYFKDFGFQGGVFFDYDYSELPQNIPLALRGMIGYKNVHSGTHVFAFDGMVRMMFRFSEKADFGLGFGGSAAIWFRPESTTPPVSNEEIVFLPSLLLGAGFDFPPFMVDFKWLINKIGEDATRMGFELYFGFRL